jgi:hypothetical protein
MPKEDDDAFEQIHGDRIKSSKDNNEDEEQADTIETSSEAEAVSASLWYAGEGQSEPLSTEYSIVCSTI